MIRKRIFLGFAFYFFQIYLALAQVGMEVVPRGGRSMGMGNSSTSLTDAYAIFNNPAGLSGIQHSQVFFGYDHRLNLSELTTLSAGFIQAKEKFTYGLATSRFGGALFNQHLVGAAIANQLGITSLGMKVSYLQTAMEGFGTGGSWLIDFGGIAELTPHLFFAAHIFNLTRSNYGGKSWDRLPTIVKSGISFRPSEKVMTNVEVEKDILHPAILKVGIEYNFYQKLWGRVGMNNQPQQLFFGIGCTGKRLAFDYAMTQHPRLGSTHHFSMNYQLSKE
jgi:hypothetical protein